MASAVIVAVMQTVMQTYGFRLPPGGSGDRRVVLFAAQRCGRPLTKRHRSPDVLGLSLVAPTAPAVQESLATLQCEGVRR